MFILFRVVEEEKRLQVVAQFHTVEQFVKYCEKNNIPILVDERFDTIVSVGDGKYRLVQAGRWTDLNLPWEQQERESMMNPLHKKFIDDYLSSEKKKKENNKEIKPD